MDNKTITAEDLANTLITKKDLELFGQRLIEQLANKLDKRKNSLQEFMSPKEFAFKTKTAYSTVIHRCKTGKLKARQDEANCAWSIYTTELQRYIDEAEMNV